LFDIYDLLKQSQHNHKSLLLSKKNYFLKGGQFESAQGGQYEPARTDYSNRREVVNLDRRRLVS
jgi:hypothetical protein